MSSRKATPVKTEASKAALSQPDLSQAESRSSLEASAQLLVFEPGLYAVGINPSDSTVGDNGLRLPCVRIDALPPGSASPGQSHVAIMTEAGWLSRPEERGFIRVEGGRASFVVTTYRRPGAPTTPEIHVSLVERRVNAIDPPALPLLDRRQASATQDEESAASAEAPPQSNAGPGFTVLVHASVLGDLVGPARTWVGGAAGHPIEAFSLRDIEGIAAEDIEYQAILGRSWNTPWIPGGTICGSRGIAMPVLGLRIRLLGAAAEAYDIIYIGRFEGGMQAGPVRNGEACVHANLVLEALQVSIAARIDAAPPVLPATPDNIPAPKQAVRRSSKRED